MKDNALFIQRFGAYIIDAIIIALLASLISIPFINSDNISNLNDSVKELSTSYINGKIDNKTFINEYSSIYFQLEQQQGAFLIISIILYILYFIVLQFYTGQTLGKKLFKIKVESTRKHLTMNQMVVRGLLINSILLTLIEFALVIFGNKGTFIYIVGSFELLQYTFMIICAFMIMFRKDRLGLHDLICNTKVVRC